MVVLLPGPTSLRGRLTYLVVFATFFFAATFLFWTTDSFDDAVHVLPIPHFAHLHPQPGQQKPVGPSLLDIPPEDRPHHPIDDLLKSADRTFDDLLANQTSTLHEAAEAYRARRGRQPPPLFDAWHAFAQNKSALIIEEFWDKIYHDLSPFWGVPAKQMREQANYFIHRISVRNHTVDFRTDGVERPWMALWSELVKSVAEWLPDMDLAINVMDESRIITPWEEIAGYMETERKNRKLVSEGELKDTFHGLKELDENPPPIFKPNWQTSGHLWEKVRQGCPPQSPARNTEVLKDFSSPPPLSGAYPRDTYEGYVKNFTLAKSPCDNPDFQALHATFIEPVSLSTTATFFPLFGGSKLPMNNEILLPPAMYLTDDPFYSGGKEHGMSWKQKISGLIWRGSASGGRNRKTNWTGFQRHRFVAMANGSAVELAELFSPGKAGAYPNFVLPDRSAYNLSTRHPETPKTNGDAALGKWVSSFSDAAFVHLLCFPSPAVPPEFEHNLEKKKELKRLCSYTDPYFAVEKGQPMNKMYEYKYLPDIDGNSFSGRYRGFLGSTSLPIKATIYDEWHDSRLVPWRHFVPMDNSFVDFYGLMEYFLGADLSAPRSNNKPGQLHAAGEPDFPGWRVARHDDVGERLALQGKEWTEKVLRREDMQVYAFRLLLEYARLCDDDREVLGWKEGSEHKLDAGGIS